MNRPDRLPIDITNLAMEAVSAHPADLVIDAPPGAGKTSLLIDLVALTALPHKRRALVAAVSNDQCDDITRRAAVAFPRLRIDRFVASGETRRRLHGIANVNIVDASAQLGAPVVVANVEKFAQVENLGYMADQLFIDEAYQARRADFDRVRALAQKACLIGDPGQISPIHQADIRLYAGDDRGPHVAAPLVMLREGTALHLQMRQSRRLPQDTVDIVQPSFYPDLFFTSAAQPGQRAITGALRGTSPIDRRLDALLLLGSLSMLALPPKVVPRFDREVVDAVIALVNRILLGREWIVHDRKKFAVRVDLFEFCRFVDYLVCSLMNVARRLDPFHIYADLHMIAFGRMPGVEFKLLAVAREFSLPKRNIGTFI